jgi:hypothetical protein
LIANLDADDLSARESATSELARLGVLAAPAFRKALKAVSSPEIQDRLGKLLHALGEDLPDGEAVPGLVQAPETLALMRGIWVLEKIGTPEARSLLQGLAKGDPNARAVRDATAALRRLTGRRQPPRAGDLPPAHSDCCASPEKAAANGRSLARPIGRSYTVPIWAISRES